MIEVFLDQWAFLVHLVQRVKEVHLDCQEELDYRDKRLRDGFFTHLDPCNIISLFDYTQLNVLPSVEPLQVRSSGGMSIAASY